MAEIELKRCPFCGGEASLWYRGTHYGRITYVECDICGAKSKCFSYYDSGVEVNTDDIGAEKALAAWNRRKGRE